MSSIGKKEGVRPLKIADTSAQDVALEQGPKTKRNLIYAGLAVGLLLFAFWLSSLELV